MSYKAVVLADSPLAYYRLNDTNTTALDSSPNGRNGTYSGVYTQSQAGALVNDTSDKSVLFNGGHVLVPATVLGGNPSVFSVEVWINISNDTTFQVIVGAGPVDGNGIQLLVWNSADGTILARVDNAGNLVYQRPGSKSVWHHVVFTADGTNVRMYFDGVQANISPAVQTAYTGGTQLTIGSYPDGSTPMQSGLIGDVAFYGTTLSAAQVSNHWAHRNDAGSSIGEVDLAASLTIAARIGSIGTNPLKTTALSSISNTSQIGAPSVRASLLSRAVISPSGSNSLRASLLSGAKAGGIGTRSLSTTPLSILVSVGEQITQNSFINFLSRLWSGWLRPKTGTKMELAKIKVADTHTLWKMTSRLTDDQSSLIPLTGASSVSLVMRKGTVTQAGTGTGTVTDPTNGLLIWTPSSADVATAGSWELDFTVHFSGGTSLPLPTALLVIAP